ncbi:MAG: efflux RND transporter periplasmic adaptor subunit [Verrucomicrobiota bacterium JB025]|nr:efflux RND transporter periplasmic adaptor subunit [Verrucomicrobiota bacterium JB025]
MTQKTDNPSKDLATIIGAENPPNRRRWWWVGLALLLTTGAGVSMLRKSEDTSPEQTQYETDTVHRGDIELTITATGNLEPTNEVTIGSELSGTVAEVYVDVNDRVTVNQKLALIDVRGLTHQISGYKANLNSAIATVTQVEASLAEDEATLARLRELHTLSDGKMPSKADMVSAEAAVTRSKADLGVAKAAVEKARAELESSEEDLTKSTLVSPINGVVLSRSIEIGQTVAASFTAPELFVIAEDLRQMELEVSVAEADIGMVNDGQTAVFAVDAWPDRTYEAKVSRVSYGSDITDNVVTYETTLNISNDDLSLRPGMTATADIHVASRHNVLLVPDAALFFNPNTLAAAKSTTSQKSSFVDSLIPKPPGRQKSGKRPEGATRPAGAGGRPGPPDGIGGPPQETAATNPEATNPENSVIWTLHDGKPTPVTVKKGISEGGFTEITGDNVTENMPVILRRKSTKP